MSDSPEELNKLRQEAVRRLNDLRADQRAKWDELDKVVQLAGDNVVATRLDALEDKSHGDGYPLWASILLSVGLSAVPVGAIAAWGTNRLLTRSRYLLGRVGVDRGALKIIDAVRKPFRVKPGSLDRRIALDFLENDKATLRLLKVVDPSAESGLKGLLKKIGKAGLTELFEAKGGKGKAKIVRSGSKDAAIVTIKEPLYDWIRASRTVEQKVINKLQEHILTDQSLNAAKLSDEIKRIKDAGKASVGKWSGMDTRLAIKRHVEACIWATTFNFDPVTKVTDTEGVFDIGPFQVLPRPVKKTVLRAPPYGKRFWDLLTDRLIEDYNTGRTYKSFGDKRGLRPRWGGQIEPAATRLAFDLWRLGRRIKKENLRSGKSLLRALASSPVETADPRTWEVDSVSGAAPIAP